MLTYFLSTGQHNDFVVEWCKFDQICRTVWGSWMNWNCGEQPTIAGLQPITYVAHHDTFASILLLEILRLPYLRSQTAGENRWELVIGLDLLQDCILVMRPFVQPGDFGVWGCPTLPTDVVQIAVISSTAWCNLPEGIAKSIHRVCFHLCRRRLHFRCRLHVKNTCCLRAVKILCMVSWWSWLILACDKAWINTASHKACNVVCLIRSDMQLSDALGQRQHALSICWCIVSLPDSCHWMSIDLERNVRRWGQNSTQVQYIHWFMIVCSRPQI